MIQLQTKEGLYKPQNTSINSDINEWKLYNVETPIINERNLLEINININDAILLGTQHSYEDSGIVTSKFQVRLDNSSIMVDAYKKCKDTSYLVKKNNCSAILNESLNEIYEIMKIYYLKDQSNNNNTL